MPQRLQVPNIRGLWLKKACFVLLLEPETSNIIRDLDPLGIHKHIHTARERGLDNYQYRNTW